MIPETHEIAWQLDAWTEWTKAHLTTDDRRTLCGRRIPNLNHGVFDYDITPLRHADKWCARCEKAKVTA